MIPFFSLARQNKILNKEYVKVFRQVQSKGVYILGENVAKFENEFAKYLGVKYAVGVASGTDALSLSLLSLGVGRGDQVIMPANSYPTAFAVTAIGAIPILVDINPLTFNIDPEMIEKTISKKTKAIIAVHLYGQSADLNKIVTIAKKFDLPLIEDCAQAHGAEIYCSDHLGDLSNLGNLSDRNRKRWKKVGTVGDVGCFSFYPSKNLGAFGDGGMVVTNSKDIFEVLKLYRMYGEEGRYKSVLLGRNSRLDELQAAFLRVKLKYLDYWNQKRRKIAKIYELRFSPPAGGYESEIKLPKEEEYARHVYHLYVIRSRKRDELKTYLAKNGIGTSIHFPKPIHLQKSFKFLSYSQRDFPESEKAAQEVLSIPCFPELGDLEIEKVIERINKFHD